MQEVIAQVLVLLRGAWRYRWIAVGTAWLIALVGWVGVQFIPDKYESTTQVYVDTESLLKPLLSGLAVNRDVMGQVGMMQAVMLSRPNLEKVAQKSDLMLGAKTPRDQEAVIDSLAERIRLDRPQGSGAARNTFAVSFEDNNPQIAHRVVRTLLDTFMEDSLGLKKTDASVAQRFLEAQIKDYEARLVEAETRLATFKQQNVGVMPGTGNTYYQQLETAVGQMQQLRQVYTQNEKRRDELDRQLKGEEPTYGLMGSAEGNPIDGQIARFKAQRDQLLLQYTEKHPQVQSLNDTIARLEQERSAGAKISTSVAAPGGDLTSDQGIVRSLDMNPVYQNLRLQLSAADADLAAIRGQMEAQQRLINELQARTNAVPEVEAELARLNRDYEVNKRQYDTLLQRLESAKISEEAEQSSENVKFRVIEPPSVPFKPSGPNRIALNTMVLLAALGAGIGLAILLGQLHPTFATRDVLQRVTGMPVIGSITAAVREAVVPWYRRQPAMVSGAVGLLLMVFLLNLVLTESIRATIRAVTG
jgi:polysaccharide chain length determinant protein (PEP-CTERM system associated)